jgi:hypothetical protein
VQGADRIGEGGAMCKAISAAVVLTVLLGGGTAGAVALQSDPNGMPAWQGVQQFRSLMNVLSVDIEYCVYEPGKFDDTWGLDPSGGTDYVYAYQVFNDLDPHPTQNPPMKGSLSHFSVHLDDNEQAANIGFVAGTNVDPSNSAFTLHTAGWDFVNPALDYMDISDVLYFTSPFGPEWDDGAITGAGLGDQQDMPSPTPEPTTLTLLGIAAVFFGARRRKAG